jgi:hypothetical protein
VLEVVMRINVSPTVVPTTLPLICAKQTTAERMIRESAIKGLVWRCEAFEWQVSSKAPAKQQVLLTGKKNDPFEN